MKISISSLLNLGNFAAMAIVSLALLSTAAEAQFTLTNLHSFSVFPNGAVPMGGMAEGVDGDFYGTTSSGGLNGGNGTVFKVTTNGTVTVLYDFTGTSDGANPQGPLVRNPNDGQFYGATRSGGSNGYGTIFKITTNGVLTTVYDMTGDDGAQSAGGLVEGADGAFYGAANGDGDGTIFRVTSTGAFSVLYRFGMTINSNDVALDGRYPNGLALALDGNLYGTTQAGGSNNEGTVFRIATNGDFNTLHSFSGSDGRAPEAALALGPSGALYGTTEFGGSNRDDFGTIFKITTNGVFTSVYNFTYVDGFRVQAALVSGSNSLYGTAFAGGSNGFGDVFEIAASGALTTLYSFSGGYDGAYPNAVLTPDGQGYFYGLATGGGVGIGQGGGGTIFKIATNGTFTALYAFPGTNDGQIANALVHGSDGNFYGTSQDGGTNNGNGNVFSVNTNGLLASLYSFTGENDGANPAAALVEGDDGNYYGTAQYDGTNGDGTIFEVTTGGTLTTLYSFTGGNDGANPAAALVEDGEGDFYGTCLYGGAYGDGTIFKITSDGQFTPLYGFGVSEQTNYFTNYNGTNIIVSSQLIPLDGGGPNGLVLGEDGNLYGTTSYGGTGDDNGTVFRITPGGEFTSLYSFTGNNDGASPAASLVVGANGELYGTTSQAGTNGSGTVFEITSDGVLTTIYPFTGDFDGSSPNALLAGADGNFYGTTSYGGTNFSGNIFQVTTNGGFNNLYSFTGGVDGGEPQTALVQGTDGSLYGTTTTGAVGGYGGVFRLSGAGLPSPAPTIINQPQSPPATLVGLSATFSVFVLGNPPLSYQWQRNGAPLSDGDEFSGVNFSTLTVDPVSMGDAGTYSVVISNSSGVTNSLGVVLSVFAPTNSTEDFDAGTNYLAVDNFALANLSFSNALTASPTNPTYNLFYAASELLDLIEQPAGSNFLSRIGVGSAGRDPFNWEASGPTNANGHLVVPATTPPLDADEFTAELRTNVLPAILVAQTNLSQITATNFTVDLTSSETHAGPVTMDFGDVEMLQAMGDAAELFIYTTYSWNLDVQLSTATNLLGKDGSFEEFLTTFPSALTVTSTADLPLARQAFINGANEYLAASQFIRSRPPGQIRLFNLDENNPQEVKKELEFRETLSNLLASLTGPVPLTISPGISVSAQAFFSGNFNPRSYLPEFQGNEFVWDTFPDPTFGGMFTGLTETQLGKILLKHDQSDLDIPGTSLSVLYNFTNFYSQTGVVQGPDGSLYGALATGGPYVDLDQNYGVGFGSIFKLTTNGQFSILYSFGSDESTSVITNSYLSQSNEVSGGTTNVIYTNYVYVTTNITGGVTNSVYVTNIYYTNIVSGGVTNDIAYETNVYYYTNITGGVTNLIPYETNVYAYTNITGGATNVEYGTNVYTYTNITGGVTNVVYLTNIYDCTNVVGDVTNVAPCGTNVFEETNVVGGVTNLIPYETNVYVYTNIAGGVTNVDYYTNIYDYTNITGGVLTTNYVTNIYYTNIVSGAVTNTVPFLTNVYYETNITGGVTNAVYATNFYYETNVTGGVNVTVYVTNYYYNTNTYQLDGAYPNALIVGSDGNLYGTTQSGGLSSYSTNDGTIFKLTTAGQLTTLYNFGNPTDQYANTPAAALVQGSDGRLYGTTQYGGGTNGEGGGTVFAISTNGAFTFLNWFSGSNYYSDYYSYYAYPNGENPTAPLIQGADGYLYGVASSGGLTVTSFSTNYYFDGISKVSYIYTNVSTPYGTIFKISPSSGEMTVAYDFGGRRDSFGNPLDGTVPNALTQGADGNLYGTTEAGGANDDNFAQNGFYYYGGSGSGDGTLFRYSPATSSFSTLLSFDQNFSDGYNPVGSLIPGPYGEFYGVASAGGGNKSGAVFVFNSTGTASNIVWLSKSSGDYGNYLYFFSSGYGNVLNPSLLTMGRDGSLYGATTAAGANGDGTVYKLNATLATPPPPVISLQPVSQFVAAGSNVTFSVAATGSGPLTYAWSFGSRALTNGGNISGANGDALTLTDVMAGNAGSYSVVVSSPYGSVTSSIATLDVLIAPIIVTNPVSQSAVAGANVAFSVVAAGPPPLTYRWRLNSNALNNDRNIAGADSNVLTVDGISASDAGSYSVLVSNPNGSVTSSIATLNVLFAPVIVTNPVSQLASSTIFTVVAAGTPPLSYQWQLNQTNIPNATNASLPATNAGTYLVIVSNLYGAATSAPAELTSEVTSAAPRPSITITSPASKGMTTDGVMGTAKDSGGIWAVFYTLTNLNQGTNVTTGQAVLTGTNGASIDWAVTNGILAGTNYIAVYAVNLASNKSAVATRKFFYESSLPLNYLATGTGAGSFTLKSFVSGEKPSTNALNIGQEYEVIAVPAANCLFGRWTAATLTNATSSEKEEFTFVMQSNLTLTADFESNIFVGGRGTYNGLFMVSNSPASVTENSAGMLDSLVIRANGDYSGKVLLQGTGYPVSGAFDAFGNATNELSPKRNPIWLDMTLVPTNPPFISGSVFSTNGASPWSASLLADRATNTLPSSRYTMLILPPTSNEPANSSPGGDGYALIANSPGTALNPAAANAKITGALADGTSFSQTVPVSQDGYLPLYASLYNGHGLVLGWINLTLTNTAGIGLTWIHPVESTGPVTDAFTNILATNQILLSLWTNPPAEVILTSLTNLSFLDGVNASNLLTNLLVKTSADGEITGASVHVSGSIDLKTGQLTVTFGSGANLITGHGAVLLNATNAGGYFTTKTTAGGVKLNP